MALVGFTDILFNIEEVDKGDTDMGDAEYFAIKESENKTRYAFGQKKTTTGTLCSLTANSGKDMYLGKAHIVIGNPNSGGSENAEVELRFNGVVVEGTYVAGDATTGVIEFKGTIGRKVTAGQVILINILAITGSNVSGALLCYEEDTGVSPQIPPLPTV